MSMAGAVMRSFSNGRPPKHDVWRRSRCSATPDAMRAALLAVLLVVPARAARDGQSWDWHQSNTPHFIINHQATWLPPGFSMGVEKVHSRLRMDLGMFSPWMAKEKINLFIYADHETYLAGEFTPPKWSNGLAVYERKAVAIPTMKDPRKMISVMAHESTPLNQRSGFPRSSSRDHQEASRRRRVQVAVKFPIRLGIFLLRAAGHFAASATAAAAAGSVASSSRLTTLSSHCKPSLM